MKRVSRLIIERYYTRLTLDFHTNKRICDEIAQIPSKKLRNKIAGFITHLMKRIQEGPVRGISIKLQEEERERRDNYVPEVSQLQPGDEGIVIDAETKEMLQVSSHRLNVAYVVLFYFLRRLSVCARLDRGGGGLCRDTTPLRAQLSLWRAMYVCARECACARVD